MTNPDLFSLFVILPLTYFHFQFLEIAGALARLSAVLAQPMDDITFFNPPASGKAEPFFFVLVLLFVRRKPL